ncbi:nitroreductase [Alisedimentitalea sp. MJ-SS2]|uniref:nitroreductase n=1 Tax=Aliisedimentitalea sp. MJ-SS2 TaxID=3049795 RepID=UPI0029148D38|nr:nitroreductase [Alisedimentitalea sp. MJ-SS2]MDU8927447.1 nitroreductase [Alisedimentitalea sp. MJ-SS2]
MTAHDTLHDILTSRYSCRAFKPDPVPRDVIERIISTAGRVPSWCNAQPWQITVTSGSETNRFREALYTHASTNSAGPDLDWPKQYTGRYKDRRRTCGWQLYEAVGIEKGDRPASAAQMMENFRLFGAPHVAIITSEADLGPYGVMDCGGFLTGFCLAAQSLGVSTIPQAAVASHGRFVHDFFDIPDTRLVLAAISFGYEDADHPANAFRTERAPLDELVFWRD